MTTQPIALAKGYRSGDAACIQLPAAIRAAITAARCWLLARFAFALETRLIQGTYPQPPSLGMPATDRGHAGQDGHGGRWWRHARIAACQRPRVGGPWRGCARAADADAPL